MKPSNHAEPSASTHYSPSVPMSVYRELAAELRANKAVIDSLNGRNQQLIQQNQRLKQEIHNVVQATLSLGQFAGVARQAAQEGFPSAIAPDTLARLVRSETEANQPESAYLENGYPETLYGESQPQLAPPAPLSDLAPPAASQVKATRPPAAASRNRVPRPIASQNAAQSAASQPRKAPAARKPQRQATIRRTETIPSKGTMSQGTATKLFTEQSGEYRSSVLDSQESKEIGGIWLVLSIILIIVTAFGAGFLIMKPLLNDR